MVRHLFIKYFLFPLPWVPCEVFSIVGYFWAGKVRTSVDSHILPIRLYCNVSKTEHASFLTTANYPLCKCFWNHKLQTLYSWNYSFLNTFSGWGAKGSISILAYTSHLCQHLRPWISWRSCPDILLNMQLVTTFLIVLIPCLLNQNQFFEECPTLDNFYVGLPNKHLFKRPFPQAFADCLVDFQTCRLMFYIN